MSILLISRLSYFLALWSRPVNLGYVVISCTAGITCWIAMSSIWRVNWLMTWWLWPKLMSGKLIVIITISSLKTCSLLLQQKISKMYRSSSLSSDLQSLSIATTNWGRLMWHSLISLISRGQSLLRMNLNSLLAHMPYKKPRLETVKEWGTYRKSAELDECEETDSFDRNMVANFISGFLDSTWLANLLNLSRPLR